MDATTVALIARALSPVISDIYKHAKGAAQNGLLRWREREFPEKLASKIDGIARIKTLWCPDKDTSLLDFYYPPKLLIDRVLLDKDVECISDLGRGDIVIQGIVGQGKSIFLRYLAITEASQTDNGRLPVFLELRTLHDKYTLIPAIHRTLSTYDVDINDETFSHLACSGRMVLLLDAFDELDPSLIRITLNDIECLSRQFPLLQIVISSRPSGDIQKISGFRMVEMVSLRSCDYEPFLRRLGVDEIKLFEIIRVIINRSGNLNSLITTPLMLILVVVVYESDYEIPSTLPEFFERLFHVVFNRHDKLKAGFNRKRYSGLSDRQLQDFFELFCFMTIQNSFGRSLSLEQFTDVFKQAVEYSGNSKCTEEAFRMDIVGGACLMLEEGVDYCAFLHKSILEYYAAAFIKHSNNEISELFYREVYDCQYQWREVLRFLSVIDRYRYVKYFVIDQISIVRKILFNSENLIDDGKFLDFLFNKYSSLRVIYLSRDSLNYSLSSVGAVVDQRFFIEEFDLEVIEFINAFMPIEIVLSELESVFCGRIKYLDALDGDLSRIELDVRAVVSHVGSKKIRNFFDEKLDLINQMELDAKAVIAEQEKRKFIFTKRG